MKICMALFFKLQAGEKINWKSTCPDLIWYYSCIPMQAIYHGAASG